jgi:hypothetical protein
MTRKGGDLKMSYVAFLLSFFSFLIYALAGLFDWDLGDFDPLAWGFVALSLGHVLTGGSLIRRVDV